MVFAPSIAKVSDPIREIKVITTWKLFLGDQVSTKKPILVQSGSGGILTPLISVMPASNNAHF